MKPLLLSAAAAAILGLSVGSAAFAQQASQTDTPYQNTGSAPTCTQLELANGIHGADCGKMSLSDVAKKKIAHDNT